MLKKIGISLVAAAVLSGCGGSKDQKETITPTSTPASSVVAKSSVAPASSAAASSVAPVANKILKIDVTQGSDTNWHLQLSQKLSLGMDSTKTYTFKYKIKTSVPKKIDVLTTTGADDYISFPTGMTSANTTTTWQPVTLTIVPTKTDTTMDFQVNLGANGAYQIWLDDISLTDADGKNEQIKNGSMVDVADWKLSVNNAAAAGVMTVETEAL